MTLQRQPDRQISLADLGIEERDDGELTPDEQTRLEDYAENVAADNISEEEKRLVALVDAMDATQEQKEELKHEIAFLFFSTTISTVLMMIGSIDAMTRPLFESQVQMPPMVYIAMGVIMSYLMSIGAMHFSGYGEAKRELKEAESNLMDFAELMEITGETPDEILQKTLDAGEAFKRKKRLASLALEIDEKKKKRLETQQ